jgi:hypothetical protein
MKGRSLGRCWWFPALLLVELTLCSAVYAQPREGTSFQTPPTSPELSQPVGPDIAGPSVEVLGGSLVTLASVPVAIAVFVFKGPSLGLGCSFNFKRTGSPSDACEERERHDAALREDARRAAILSGLAVGLLGSALVIHGAIRIRRTKTAFRLAKLSPAAWTVQPLPTRAMASVEWKF